MFCLRAPGLTGFPSQVRSVCMGKRIGPEPIELACLPPAWLGWQKGWPRAKPLGFQTTIVWVEHFSKFPLDLVVMHTGPSCDHDTVTSLHYHRCNKVHVFVLFCVNRGYC